MQLTADAGVEGVMCSEVELDSELAKECVPSSSEMTLGDLASGYMAEVSSDSASTADCCEASSSA